MFDPRNLVLLAVMVWGTCAFGTLFYTGLFGYKNYAPSNIEFKIMLSVTIIGLVVGFFLALFT